MKGMEINPNPSHSDGLAQRKGDHIQLAVRAQTSVAEVDPRFNYEPMFFSHVSSDERWPTTFMGATLDFPIWISSMTGGTQEAKAINQNLARLCGKYHLGMGLGSCRALLTESLRLQDFSVRKYLGHQPLLANIGIAQLEQCLAAGSISSIHEMVNQVEASGLIVHINPMQEWLQPEGDRYYQAPLKTLEQFLENVPYPVVVKEVGQGFGPKSLEALLNLPLAGVEFGAFGGTNFALLESLRGSVDAQKLPFIKLGHSAAEMISIINALPDRKKEFIISGGISNVLDGYELLQKLKRPALIGMASAFLAPARESFESLEQYFLQLRESLLAARGLLTIKENN
jgi:isopentenyl-diphosphate Delta-isomerase